MTDRSRKRKKGVTLLLTLIIMTTLAVVVTAFLYMVSVQTKGSGYTIDSAKAFWLAEAGIQQVIYKLKTDGAYRTTPSPNPLTGTLGTGSYSVSVVKNASTYTLTSTGTVEGLSRTIEQSIIAVAGGADFSDGIYADGNTLNFQGSSGTINGDIRGNGNIQNYSGMTINGTVLPNSPTDFAICDYPSYLAIANNVVNTSKTFTSGNTYSGIWYVDGSVSIEKNVTINGSIIATGGITISGSNRNPATNINITPGSNYPALVARTNINSSYLQTSTIKGLIYAGNNVSFDNNGTGTLFSGSILAGSNISMKQGSGFTVTYNSQIQSNPPPYFSSAGGSDATVTPQKDWQEQ